MAEDTAQDAEPGWFGAEIATLGDRIAGAREAAGLSQAQLARRIAVGPATLRGWENDTSEPRANRLGMLAAVLGVSVGWLLTGEGVGPHGPPDATADTPDADPRAALAELRRLAMESARLADRIARLEDRLSRSLAPR